MALKVGRIDLWVAGIEDVPGGLSKKLAVLADAGVSLAFVLARRAPEKKKGVGVVFVAPIKGAKQAAAAKKAGFSKSKSLQAVCVEGPDKRGLGARITAALGAAGINMRGLSAVVIGRKFALYLALDSSKDAAAAARIIRKM